MGSKDKRRKQGKHVPVAKVPRPAGDDAPESAKASVQTPVAPVAREASKPKPAKPAPVLTRKPSRFRFFVDAFNELKKAHWPSRREALRLSLLVATVCVVVGVLLGALDFLFSGLMRFLLF